MINRYIFNFPSYARELNNIIKSYIPSDHPINEKQMIKAMERLIHNLIRVIISDIVHSAVPKEYMEEEFAYKAYAESTYTDYKKIREILGESFLLDQLLTDIQEIVEKNIWGIYSIRPMMIEYLGDWRIIEWEKEHLDERGNYVTEKDNPESVTAFGLL